MKIKLLFVFASYRSVLVRDDPVVHLLILGKVLHGLAFKLAQVNSLQLQRGDGGGRSVRLQVQLGREPRRERHHESGQLVLQSQGRRFSGED